MHAHFFLMLSFYTLLMILFCLCYCHTLILLPAQTEYENRCPHPWTTGTKSSGYEVLNPDAPKHPWSLIITGLPGSLCASGLQDFHISQVSRSLQRLCPRTRSFPGSLLRLGWKALRMQMPHSVLPANEKQMRFSSPFVSGVALQLLQTLAGHSGGRPAQQKRTKWHGCGHPAALKEARQQETGAGEEQRPR